MNETRATGHRTSSLRMRLLIALACVVGVIWIIVVALTYGYAQRELDRLLDAHLVQSARLLLAQSAHELEEFDLEDDEPLAGYRQSVAFQVWRDGVQLVLKSADAPEVRLSSHEHGLSDVTISEIHWRVFSQWDRHRQVLVQVAEDHAVRDRLARRIALNTTLPLLLSVPLLAIVMSWAIARALRPMVALGREVERRGPLALDAIAAAGVPAEIVPLVEKLNDLFARVQRSFENERRFTANAAHELRTPISAVRVQAEVARDAQDTQTARAALDNVIAACDRLTRLISQLLLLARVEEQGVERSTCRLDAIAKEVIAELAPKALESSQDIALDAPEPIEIAGNASLLAAMLRNLIDNSLRHGGSPLHVMVSLTRRDGSAHVTVEDDGRGVPPAWLDALGSRFFRPTGTQAGGSGLGLALARRIAEWHGGSLDISVGPQGRGLRVCAALPLITTDAPA